MANLTVKKLLSSGARHVALLQPIPPPGSVFRYIGAEMEIAESLDGCGSLAEIPSLVTIENMFIGSVNIQSVEDIEALAGYDGVSGDIFIIDTGLTSLVGLEAIKYVGRNIFIEDNASLTSLNGFSPQTIRSLTINGNGVLSDISALDSVVICRGFIFIEDNDSLVSIDDCFPVMTEARFIGILEDNLVSMHNAFQNLTTASVSIDAPVTDMGCAFRSLAASPVFEDDNALTFVGVADVTILETGIPVITFNVTGGVGTRQFYAVQGLPSGMSIDIDTGAISGPPDSIGVFSDVIVRVVDDEGSVDTDPFDITVIEDLSESPVFLALMNEPDAGDGIIESSGSYVAQDVVDSPFMRFTCNENNNSDPIEDEITGLLWTNVGVVTAGGGRRGFDGTVHQTRSLTNTDQADENILSILGGPYSLLIDVDFSGIANGQSQTAFCVRGKGTTNASSNGQFLIKITYSRDDTFGNTLSFQWNRLPGVVPDFNGGLAIADGPISGVFLFTVARDGTSFLYDDTGTLIGSGPAALRPFPSPARCVFGTIIEGADPGVPVPAAQGLHGSIGHLEIVPFYLTQEQVAVLDFDDAINNGILSNRPQPGPERVFKDIGVVGVDGDLLDGGSAGSRVFAAGNAQVMDATVEDEALFKSPFTVAAVFRLDVVDPTASVVFSLRGKGARPSGARSGPVFQLSASRDTGCVTFTTPAFPVEFDVGLDDQVTTIHLVASQDTRPGQDGSFVFSVYKNREFVSSYEGIDKMASASNYPEGNQWEIGATVKPVDQTGVNAVDSRQFEGMISIIKIVPQAMIAEQITAQDLGEDD